MAREKAKVRDNVRSFLNKRTAHDLTPQQRTARALNRDLRQLRAELESKNGQIAALQASADSLSSRITAVEGDLEAAIAEATA